jgi:16S rRNA (cytosine1402-N4)-methyltransferase
VIDGTVGGGGHAEAILKAAADVHLLGIDRDDEALAAAGMRLSDFGPRVSLVRGSYTEMRELARDQGWSEVDRILLDLGVSSHQIDTGNRGFSHRQDGPLDMRMDRRSPVTAASILNRASQEELARIFREYGEERQAARVAHAVVERRQQRPWERTGEFAELVTRIVGHPRHGHLPPATRCFQALRIAVNQELEQLQQGLERAVELLAPGGRLVVISFHSLEDRMVKNFFRQAALTCVCPPDFPECRCDKQATLKVLTRKPEQATAEELEQNRRAAPAKLRAAEKLGG